METQKKQIETMDASPFSAALPNPTNSILPPTVRETANLSQSKLSAVHGPEYQWQRAAKKTTHFLEELPEYLSSFFQENRRSLSNVALVLTAIITLKVAIAVLDAINDIPLLSPTFELIGIGYVTWFVLRYLAKSQTRQELNKKIQSFKQEILGE
ncbi:CAAD domain-containing protein [Umezakia ovalisporum]|jgi:hypothetical protein|uniref:CAAD domain-containing protein n=1 Tax=Umezakia ovalisporum FSS-43 TaxID=2740520 RepID=A0ABT6K5U8_9CYAN|nr:CAAD domain-containing protein [Umezakia ovalisporum]MBI1243103.1 hypothetical protein [Nostoc sp. RI_552]MDH6057699.1 CAAD domain-containing protein [Umezakia ovalisporum FSS-43]MDH6072276.1 CAAD domain-containing protein [Umezakia ovalisporum CobakiLakeA]MDH6074467.1 CAAD domain-containing protein [Umezakia ovalisporum CS-1034]MDH6081612.1 CAAD domain-containing protein [Umezakia ovalisporum FSS-44]